MHILNLAATGLIEVAISEPIIVECAVAGKCEAIVTGDKDLLRLRSYHGIRMITARELTQQDRAR